MNNKPQSERKKAPIMELVPFPVLATNQLVLRQMTLHDASELFALRTDARVNQFIDRPATSAIHDVHNFIETINKQIANNELLYWVIEYRGNSGVLGTICLWNFSKSENCAELGYELHPSYHGQGIMQEAVSAVLAFAFNTIRLRTLVAVTREDNEPSIKLLIKNRFKKAPSRSELTSSTHTKKYEEFYLTKEMAMR